jgi:hypothetical protein
MRTYEHKEYGEQRVPTFKIVGWCPAPDALVQARTSTPLQIPTLGSDEERGAEDEPVEAAQHVAAASAKAAPKPVGRPAASPKVVAMDKPSRGNGGKGRNAQFK